MITCKQVREQLIAHPLHTSLLVTSSLLLICSGYIKPPIFVALLLVGVMVYTVLYFGSRMPELLSCCKHGDKQP
jgi:hypothetical protein